MEFEHCSQCDCGQKRPIVNKKYKLCDDKNFKRLHNGKSRHEVQVEKAKKQNADRKFKPIVRKPLKRQKIKVKKRPIDVEYSKIIKELTYEREPKCTGCGRFQAGEIKLSNSHIISRKQCQEIGRLELIAEKENITYHCMDFGEHEGCHRKWEGPRKIELNDFEQNMLFVKSIDENLFKRLLFSVEENLNK